MFKRENLRKNFLRVKQNIDQNLGRAEQTKVLTEDQQENEKRVDLVKHAFQNIAKKAGAVLQATGPDFEKKLKKLPESALSNAMIESAQSLGADTLLGNVCNLCGDCQLQLAREQVTYEMTVEQELILPLQAVVDDDIPSIIKLRKALSKSILDMDSAKTRLNQVMRQSQVPGANMANAAAKADLIKEEYEETTLKMENVKDNLSIELCNFAAKECEHSTTLLKFLQAQASYHRRAMELIQECVPLVQLAITNSAAKPCYGMSLEEHLRLTGRDIALVLEACVLTLLEFGMEEEGLFRIAGAAVKLKKLKACFDAHSIDMEEFSSDPHTVAGALKQYLRELPEPLLTYELYEDFLQAATLPQDQRLQTLWTIINRLPKANYNNFRYLVKFLAKLGEKSDVNKMKPSNIAIVIGPNLMWSENSNTPNMMTTGTVSAIIEVVVTHADWFFPGEIDFNIEDVQEGGQADKPQSNTESTSSQTPVQPVSPSLSPASNNPNSPSNQLVGSDSPEMTNTLQRRGTRKPAPPPPPDRPYTVSVTATTGAVLRPGESSSNSLILEGSNGHNPFTHQTWPRAAPLASPDSPTEQSHPSEVGDKSASRISGGQLEKHLNHHLQRPEQAPPERPRVPPPLNSPVASRGHQRSVSTSALLTQKVGTFNSSVVAGVPNAGSLSSYSIAENVQGGVSESSAAADSQGLGYSQTLGRQPSVRPRPSPPPPPPKVSKENEDTKL